MPRKPIKITEQIANSKVQELISMAFSYPALNVELDSTTLRAIQTVLLKPEGQQRRINIDASLELSIEMTAKLYIPSPLLFLYYLDGIKEKLGIKGGEK